MKVSLQIHARFIFCIFLYCFSSENAFCYAFSLVKGNKHHTTPKDITIIFFFDKESKYYRTKRHVVPRRLQNHRWFIIRHPPMNPNSIVNKSKNSTPTPHSSFDFSKQVCTLPSFVLKSTLPSFDITIINRPNNCGNCTDFSIFNVLDYGAKGDGVTDDAKAFGATWGIACKTKGGIMLVPSGFTFLLQTIYFDGSQCQHNIVVQVEGKIVAPLKEHWMKPDLQWILFKNVSKGIKIMGEGIIEGFGDSWWKSKIETSSTPHAVRFEHSSNITISGITMKNGPRMHLFIEYSDYVTIHNFTVRSPADSPNTDCIHISRARHVRIYNTTLACGDDCVSIQTGCSDVEICDVECGPGHGYSIGGLGPNKQEAHVYDISVFNSSLHDAKNGVRIKTWPGGYGTVQNVVFSNITMLNVGTPIVIDQFYCGGHKICNERNMNNSVAISDVMFKGISGTYSFIPISLACSHINPCKNLIVVAVDLVPKPKKKAAQPYCIDAHGRVLTNTTPPLDKCLEAHEALLPSPSPSPSPTSAPLSIMPAPAPAPRADMSLVLMKRVLWGLVGRRIKH